MNGWGVFESDDEVHVMPATAQGDAADGHVPAPDCECDPEVIGDPALDPSFKRLLVRHRAS